MKKTSPKIANNDSASSAAITDSASQIFAGRYDAKSFIFLFPYQVIAICFSQISVD
jgi:hypothetical protein